MSDEEFNAGLQHVVELTTQVVNEHAPHEYETTVFLITGHEISIETLVPGEEEEEADPYELLRGFGRHLAGEVAAGESTPPDAVFVAGEAEAADGECIFITGSAPDGRTNAARLAVDRRKKGRMRITDAVVHSYSPGGPALTGDHNAAAVLMNEIRAGHRPR
jgi:hypothetical protein